MPGRVPRCSEVKRKQWTHNRALHRPYPSCLLLPLGPGSHFSEAPSQQPLSLAPLVPAASATPRSSSASAVCQGPTRGHGAQLEAPTDHPTSWPNNHGHCWLGKSLRLEYFREADGLSIKSPSLWKLAENRGRRGAKRGPVVNEHIPSLRGLKGPCHQALGTTDSRLPPAGWHCPHAAAVSNSPDPGRQHNFPGHLVTSTSSNWLRPYSTLLSCIYPPHSRA